MSQQSNKQFVESEPIAASLRAAQDYERVCRAIAFVTQAGQKQPSLEAVAYHVGLSPAHFQRLFKRWAGISPKAFLQAVTFDRARALVRDSGSILDVAYEVGLPSPGRPHALFIDHEAMTPGEYKHRGAGFYMIYGFHDCPFGRALIMATSRGVTGLAFADGPKEERAALDDMTARWPAARYREDMATTERYNNRIFKPERWQPENPLKVVLIGTEFEIRVWQTLLRIPLAQAVTYSDIANKLGAPKAPRAVGSAVGRNPISFVVPCHRVLRKGGGLGGYHWGITRKQAIIGWEAAHTA